MRILRTRAFQGPNVHHHHPVLLAELDLEGLAERESREFAGFNKRLVLQLPGLRDHTCAAGHPGAFISRLSDGTYFGHIVEHVALELSGLAGIGVRYGKTRLLRAPSVYTIVVRYRNEAGMRRLLEVAVDLVQATLDGRAYALDSALDEVRALVERTSLGPSTQCIVDAARRRGIPDRRLDDGTSLVQLGYGRQRRLIQAAFTDVTSGIGADLASDKHLTKEMLDRAFIPVPIGRAATTLEEAREVWEDRGRRAVVKPLDGNQGKGVTIGVHTEEALAEAFSLARQYSGAVIVEEQFTGEDYRVLVVDGTMTAASLRQPPEVVGDGRSSIAQLIEALNEDPRRGRGHEKPLTRVNAADPILLGVLARAELTLESVPEAGAVVRLRESANLSTGGSATDVTDLVHPDVRCVCERAARLLGLNICGLDLITPDISKPFCPGSGIIEVNAGPGLRMHQFPSEGRSRDVGGAIVRMLFPGSSNGRIPIIAITGTNGKTTVTRMIAHALKATGARVGMTTTDGIYLDGRPLARGDMTGPKSAQAILSDPAVDMAVLETARGGIVRGGLGYDVADVAVMTNIQLDHVGQDGIEDLDDLLHIKSLVIERVREGGTVVLNADDPLVLSLATNPRLRRRHVKVALFSQFPNKFEVRRHVAAGGAAYVPRDGWIVELNGEGRTRIAEISAIPATFLGAASCNVANAMAAVAACRAVGASPGLLRHALTDFDTNEQNSGRMNVYSVGRGHVVVDYGHNPAAFQAMGEVARAWARSRIIGVIAVPGDRADHVVEQCAQAAARVFDRVVVKEDDDTRGRRRGEIAELLCRALASAPMPPSCEVVLDEGEALRRAITSMEAGDLVVVFYDNLLVIEGVLREHGAMPARLRRQSDAAASERRYGT